ncbi:BON domain-containing protein [Paraburkholderia tropica]|uniref:BON domain-containing protein n=1 Tax=Paraburkholderia tropica TaxID=92647 RepID=UPI0021AD1D1F|nr:BON domain-containing protein [Paraburkholderia tropica]
MHGARESGHDGHRWPPSRAVHVTTERGVVTLTGTVPDDAQRDHAKSSVQDLDGVKSNTNGLKVGKP